MTANTCGNCGAPGGAPFCGAACEEAAPGPETPVYTPASDSRPPSGDPWATAPARSR